MLNSKLSPEKQEAIIGLSPKLIRLIVKVIKFGKGGYSKEERQELAGDLLELSVEVLGDLA